MNTQEALDMTLEAFNEGYKQGKAEALAQSTQEPYGWELFFNNGKHAGFTTNKGEAAECGENKLALYTHPAPAQEYLWDGQLDNAIIISKKKEWVGLSDDEIEIICAKMAAKLPNKKIDLIFARAIEQELKTKNGFSDVKEKNT